MTIVIAVFTVVLAIGCWYLTKSIFHPSVIIGLVWGVTYLIYINIEHPLWTLSAEFTNVFSFWVIPFMIIAYVVSCNTYNISQNNDKLFFNKKQFEILYPYVCILSILLILLLIYYSGGLGDALRSFMLEKKEYPLAIKVLMYTNVFATVYTFYALIHSDKISRNKLIFLFFLLITISFLKSAKGAFLRIFVAGFFILYRKKQITITKILIGAIFLITILVCITLFRGDATAQQDDAFINYIYIYLLSPFTAFDLLINNELSPLNGDSGSASFPFIFTILNIFGFDFIFTENPGWVSVPVYTNVYTAIWGFYSDFGWYGVSISSLILGSLWGWIYKLQRKGNQIALLFYALTCFSLFFQGFGDFFVEAFSMDLQIFIFSIVIVKGVRLYNKNLMTYFGKIDSK